MLLIWKKIRPLSKVILTMLKLILKNGKNILMKKHKKLIKNNQMKSGIKCINKKRMMQPMNTCNSLMKMIQMILLKMLIPLDITIMYNFRIRLIKGIRSNKEVKLEIMQMITMIFQKVKTQ